MNNSIFKCMGVVNATPNSFSDASKFSSSSYFQNFLDSLYSHHKSRELSCLDIGAESSAPFNDPISDEEEIDRLRTFLDDNFESLKEVDCISIDTYKVETMSYFLTHYSSKFRAKIIWNDISGDYKTALNLLIQYKNLDYVVSHNLAPKRELSSDHMNYLCTDINLNVCEFFNLALTFFKRNGVDPKRIILDPTFGFSKTKEQNFELITELCFTDTYHRIHDRWLFGLSKKSFLQSLSPSKSRENKLITSEFSHSALISHLMRSFSGHEVFFRVHDPLVFWNILELDNILKEGL